MSWLLNSVEAEIAQSILWMDNASEIWTELKDRFYQGDVFRISDIQEEICTLKQGDSSISSYYTKLKKLWQELDNFRPIPTCDCAVTCKAIDKIRAYKDGDQVIRFLKGLNDQYSHVRAQIMLMDPLPTICKVYSLLVQQERQVILPFDESKLLFVPPNNGQGRGSNGGRGRGQRGGGRSTAGRGRGNKVCTHCGMTNHVVDNCFKKHGYPPHWQQNGVVNNYASHNGVEDESQSEAHEEHINEQESGLLSFIPDQHQALLALLQNSTSISSHNVNQLSTKPYNSTGIICTFPTTHKSECFILDTGATDHVCFSKSFFQCIRKIKPITIKLPNGSVISTCYAGSIVFDNQFFLTDVLYIPDFSFNLISVPKLTTTLHCQLLFDNSTCLIQDVSSKKMIGAADLSHGLYTLKSPLVSLPPKAYSHCINSIHTSSSNKTDKSSNKTDNCNLWHLRFGHVSNEKLLVMNKIFPSIQFIPSTTPCDVCFYAKQKRLPFPHSNHISKNNFDLIHMDIWGPVSVPSILGYKYFLTIVDDKSRFTWIFFMKLKSETSHLIKSFVSLIQTQFNTTIKCIRSDNGTEFLLRDFYRQTGIVHQTSCVGTPQQNGIVERKHQHILAVTRALLFQAHLPKTFWAHAVSHAVHIINRLPTLFLYHKSPYQILYASLPDINFLKVFGSLCFATTLKANRHKLDSRSRKCINLGFKSGVKGHILFDLQSKEMFLSRDVIFFETIFPYMHSLSSDSPSLNASSDYNYTSLDDLFLYDSLPTSTSASHSSTHSTHPNSNHSTNPNNLSTNTSLNHIPDISTPLSTSNNNSTPLTTSNHLTSPSPPILPTPTNIPLRKSTRHTKPPSYLQDFHCNLVSNTNPDSISSATTSSSDSKYPISSFLSYQ
jgi:hypothetical protein